MSSVEGLIVVSDQLKVPPTANEVEEDERRELMLSDRKASKVLGVIVLRAPRPKIDQKASKILGTNVVRSGIDLEIRLNGWSTSPRRNRLREKFLMAKVAPLNLGGRAERESVIGKEGQRVVLSPKWKSSRIHRRHTISYEPGLDLLLPSAPSSPTSMGVRLSPTGSTLAELLRDDGGEGSDSGLESLDVEPEDIASETVTPVDLGVIPPPVQTWRNPVLERRREMLRSANKSVQILGIEARRAILKKMEKENAGRIGWSGV